MSENDNLESFKKWWDGAHMHAEGMSPELAARTAWDAAIIAVLERMEKQKRTLVTTKEYGRAAAVRDEMNELAELLAEKGLWKHKVADEQWNTQFYWHVERYRKLSTKSLLKLPLPPAGCEAARALEAVKREQLGHDPENSQSSS
jgi:hypothetical protein